MYRRLMRICIFVLWAAVPQLTAGSVYTFYPQTGQWFAEGSWIPTGIPHRVETAGLGDTAIINPGQTVSVGIPPNTYHAQWAGASVLTNAGTLSLVNGTGMAVDQTLNNSGLITIGLAGSTATITEFGLSNATINGSGTIELMNSGSTLAGSGSGLVYGQTIQGTGTIKGFSNLSLDGTLVQANALGGTLNLNHLPSVAGGTFRAANQGTLAVYDSNFNGATMQALDGSSVYLNSRLANYTMTGGSLSTSGSGVVTVHGYNLNGVNNSGNVVFDAGAIASIAGNMVNSGTYTLGAGSPTVRVLDGTGLSGGGSLVLAHDSAVLQGAGVLTLTGHTIEGRGTIESFSQLNAAGGTVNANSTGGTLTLKYGEVNSGTLMASNGGRLNTWDTNINGSSVRALDGSSVTLASRLGDRSMTGGTLSNEGSGAIQVAGFTLNGVTNLGTTTLGHGGATSGLAGNIVNSGTFTLGNSTVRIANGTSLSGGGSLVLGDSAAIVDGSGSLTLSGHSIEGRGTIQSFSQIDAAGGTVNANSNGGTLTLKYSTINGGTLMASNGGQLNTWDTTINGSAVRALDGSTVSLSSRLNNFTMTGGTLSTEGSGVIQFNNFALNGVTNQGNLVVPGGGNGTLAGVIDNSGTLTVGAASSSTILHAAGATLSGGGKVIAAGAATLQGTLTNQNNRIEILGASRLEGTLNNAGSLYVAGGSSLYMPLGQKLNNTGSVRVDAGGAISGYWQNLSPNVSGGVLSGGTFDIAGTMQIAGYGQAITTNAANVILDGPSSAMTEFGSSTNKLAQLNTNTGGFSIVNGRNFTSAGNFANSGTLNVGAGSTFYTGSGHTGAYTQTGGSTVVNGTLVAGTLNLTGGSLSGAGTVDADLLLSGTLNPGNSPGTITVTGNATLDSESQLNMELLYTSLGGFDRFLVAGDLFFDGTLNFLTAGYTPVGGDLFAGVLSWGGALTLGEHFRVTGLDLGGGRSLQLQWNANSLDVSVNADAGAVPEPSAALLLAVPLALLYWRSRRRAR